MGHGIKGSHIVVNHHTRSIDTCTNAVVENQWYSEVDELLEVVIFLRVFCLRNDDATHFVLVERFADAHLAVVLFITLCYHDGVTVGRGFLFDAA